MSQTIERFEQFITDGQKMAEAYRLLIDIYLALPTYNSGLSPELDKKLKAFFDFDDSE